MALPRPVLRWLHQILLAVICTPLPGGLLLALRAMQAGRRNVALAAASVSFSGLGLALALAFLVPWSVTTVEAYYYLVLAATGAVLAFIESRHALATPAVGGDSDAPRESLRDVARWAVVLPVCWSPLALISSMFVSRWGSKVFEKPSLPAATLYAALFFLVPAGVCLGLWRWLAGRRRGAGSLAALAAALPAVTLAALADMGLVYFIVEKALELPTVDPLPERLQWPWISAIVGTCGLFWLVDWLVSASGLRRFALRTLTSIALIALTSLSGMVAASELVVRVHEALALRAARRGDESATLKHNLWLARRAPLSDAIGRTLERAALSAFILGKNDEVTAVLDRANPDIAREYSDAAGILDTLRAIKPLSGAVPGPLARLKLTPIVPESWLDAGHSAMLSAAWVALPRLSETALKQKLRELSATPDAIELDRMDSFAALHVRARVLGLEARPVSRTGLGSALAAGVPVLYRDPFSGTWGLIVAHAPGSGAIEWLDFRRWRRGRERGLDSREVAALLASEERGQQAHARVYVETRRLAAETLLLPEEFENQGGLLAVLVPLERVAEADSWGVGTTLAGERLTLDRARTNLERGAYVTGRALLASLPPGAEREEALGLAELAFRARAVARGRDIGPLAPAAAALLASDATGRLSAWGLSALCSIARRSAEVDCATAERIGVRLSEAAPGDPNLQSQRVNIEMLNGRAAAAAEAVLRQVRSAGWSENAMLAGISVLAPMDAAAPAEHAVWKKTLELLLSRVPIVVEFPDLQPRWANAHWQAGRAAVAEDPRQAAELWGRAVAMTPDDDTYHDAYARALDRVGRTADAAVARRHAAECRMEYGCKVILAVCSPTVPVPELELDGDSDQTTALLLDPELR